MGACVHDTVHLFAAFSERLATAMALVGRSPVRLAATTSSAPYESMVSSLQAHIDQLVQKNKTYEHTIQKLQAAIQDEKEKSLDTASRLKAIAALERETWREGCDSLLATHRIVHLRTNMELEKTRSLVLREKEENRKERLSVLQRDYKLTLFQARELELETRIAELEDLLEEMAEQNENDAVGFVQQHEQDVETLKDRLNKSEAARKEAHANLREVGEDKKRLEVRSLLLDNRSSLIDACILERAGVTPPRVYNTDLFVYVKYN
jgi:chromosome segregation ATPase